MTGPRQKHFRTFALYNRWANDTLYETASKLTPRQLGEDRGAFFKSVLGTLNHMIVTDRLWMGRLEGKNPKGVRLDEMLYTDFAAVRAARAVENERIIADVFALREEDLDSNLSYEMTDGTPLNPNLGDVLAHVFNHHTHHRGQAHDLIGQIIGADKTPALDLMVYLRGAAKDDRP